MNVLVTGGTGTLGRHLVMQLRQAGHRARILTRHVGGHVDAVEGDLATGQGLLKAVRGMDAIVHAGSATRELFQGRATDVLGTRRLLAVAREARVGHLVYVSIVGMEGVAYPYYKTKLAAEAVVREDILPWSILRATQFHSLMELVLGRFCKLPGIATIPTRWQFQPVDAREVARRLVEVVTHEPAGVLPDFGGPEVRDFKSIALSWLAARKQTRRVIDLWLPFKFSRQFAEGRLLCPEHKDGTITFEQHLTETYQS
ncbi:MAG TPA: NAD(P)H-binding protein [Candidatus Dormibacteraeota bacterium]|nr:NAD(P)H-binding protein [Candidatus Dormibacteraeota bacterium]